MTNRDMAFFNAAKEMAKLSDYPRHKVGCVVVQRNRIISSGCNTNKTNPLQKRYNRVRFAVDTPHRCHAETRALLPLLKQRDLDFSHLKVYLYREHADGSLAMSRCCPSCMQMLKDYGIQHIYYTNEGSYCEEYLIE